MKKKLNIIFTTIIITNWWIIDLTIDKNKNFRMIFAIENALLSVFMLVDIF